MTTPRVPYDCREAFRRLDDYLDRELTAEEMDLVRAHLNDCAVCAPEFEHEATWMRGVRDKLARIDAPAEFRARLLRALGSQDE
jgi:mycothiol system anti-sigma-R factor